MHANDKATLGIYAEIRKSRSQIFDFKFNDVANNITQGFYRNGCQQMVLDSFFKSNPPLLGCDKELFNQYVELVRSRFMHTNVNYADLLLQQANVLLNELKRNIILKTNDA